MNNIITISTSELRTLIVEAVNDVINPWLTMDDMMARYHDKTTHTITAMERRGEIPQRAKTGLWLRSEVQRDGEGTLESSRAARRSAHRRIV